MNRWKNLPGTDFLRVGSIRLATTEHHQEEGIWVRTTWTHSGADWGQERWYCGGRRLSHKVAPARTRPQCSQEGFPRPQSLAPLSESTQEVMQPWRLRGACKSAHRCPREHPTLPLPLFCWAEEGELAAWLNPEQLSQLTCCSYFHVVQLNTIISVLAELILNSSYSLLLLLKAKKIISCSTTEDCSPSF